MLVHCPGSSTYKAETYKLGSTSYNGQPARPWRNPSNPIEKLVPFTDISADAGHIIAAITTWAATRRRFVQSRYNSLAATADAFHCSAIESRCADEIGVAKLSVI